MCVCVGGAKHLGINTLIRKKKKKEYIYIYIYFFGAPKTHFDPGKTLVAI